MLLFIFGFMNLSIIDILDILLVAGIIFLFIKWLQHSAAMNILLAIICLYIVMAIVNVLNMKIMSQIMGVLVDVGVLGLIIIFQPEIRHFLMRFGTRAQGSTWMRVLGKFLGRGSLTMESGTINEIAEACRAMSEDKTGALIVIPHEVSLDYISSTGDKIDAAVSRRLLMNLFFKNSPLHDGAIIISRDRIVSARCTLPITSRTDIPASFGMRHKAALGITEETDADVIVVSEETGNISFVNNSIVTRIGNINELKLKLGAAFSGGKDGSPSKQEASS